MWRAAKVSLLFEIESFCGHASFHISDALRHAQFSFLKIMILTITLQL